MTREEAIGAIKEHCYFNNLIPVARKALDMAVKALEQEPCEDAVSRNDIYFKLTNGAYPNETIEQFIDRLVKELDALPSVTPQQKTGHWILNDNQCVQAVGCLTYHCSECGCEISSKYHGKISLLKEYPYCHCGAKMESEGSEDYE